MANGKNDIRLHVGWLRHYKTEMLRANLGDGAALCLLQLWFYAAEHRPDGDLSTMSIPVIEAAASWRGEKGKFYEQLLECGWLDSDKVLHDWEVEQPWVSNRDARSAAGRFAAEERWKKERSALRVLKRDLDPGDKCEPHAGGMPGASDGHADRMRFDATPNAPSPLRLPSDSFPSPSPSPSEHIHIGNSAQENGKEAEVRSSDETLLTALLVTKTACAEGAARKQIVTLLEHFGAERVEAAILEHAKPAMPPWEFGKIALAALNGEAPSANGAAPPPPAGEQSSLLARLAADKAKSDALKAEFDAWCALPGNENKTRRDYYDERRKANG